MSQELGKYLRSNIELGRVPFLKWLVFIRDSERACTKDSSRKRPMGQTRHSFSVLSNFSLYLEMQVLQIKGQEPWLDDEGDI